MAYGYIWTDEQKKYLAGIVEGRTVKEITRMINGKFDLTLKESQIESAKKRYNLKSGLDFSFKEGNEAWNKGTIGVMKANSGSWQKGKRYHSCEQRYRNLYNERVNAYGYIEIKTGEPNVWELKHRWIYKKHNGKIDKGYKCIFLNGDCRDFRVENLEIVPNDEMLILNINNMRYNNSELTRASLNVVRLINAARKAGKK